MMLSVVLVQYLEHSGALFLPIDAVLQVIRTLRMILLVPMNGLPIPSDAFRA
jgi:hypothetical protein